ncbi:MAG: DUF1156 domain-containing protein [Holophagales bacterium]|jgi:putative DNA methylase|nr:DUF1156 domain-containing protein [Holophagales bacterium]
MEYKKKLIEVALPLEAINTQSAREKSIRHGHPSTLHLWWARRPLAAARAVIWASLVDDPSSLPERFPTEEEQSIERERLFKILSELVKWENSNNQEILAAAKAEIMKSTNGKPPALLDPFAGGGSIPLEAQRLGLEAHASDLNPVAVMINKAMIEIPPKFAGQPPINPEAKANSMNTTWTGAQGLAEDVRYYGKWMKQKAFQRIGHLYPKVKDENGREHTVIAWIWARTVKCPNTVCGCEMPLTGSFVLSKKKGKEAHIKPTKIGEIIKYEVKYGTNAPQETVNRKGAMCFFCGSPVGFPYIRETGKEGKIGSKLIAIVAEGKKGRLYISPDKLHTSIANIEKPKDCPDANLPNNPRDFKSPNYGLTTFSSLFTNRQLTAMTTFSNLVTEVQQQIVIDGGSQEYSYAIKAYLAFAVSKIGMNHNALCSWHNGGEKIQTVFARQSIPMVWDYTEANPFSNSTGCWDNMLEWVTKTVTNLPNGKPGRVIQQDAQTACGLHDIMVSTDPPYYDNIGYADLSDFFYVWLRYMLKNEYPDLFKTMLVPKTEELVATPYRFGGNKTEAKLFFENGMLQTFKQIGHYVKSSIPMTVYYAYKQSADDDNSKSSTGWETMLIALINAGFAIAGTWPMRTEMESRALGRAGTNALASSIVLVCRKRPADAPICTRRDFINALKREIKPALQKLQASNIAPVDLAQSAIGPGMEVYSRFSKVLEANGMPMSVRSALQIINQELDLYFTEQDGELDRDSRFCIDLYTQYAFNDVKFGEADVLARAKNTSVEKLAGRGVLYAQKGVVRLLARIEIPERIDTEIIWLLTQQLTHAMEKDGVAGAAKIVTNILTSEPEQAKALAYRLFNIAERRGWAQEAYAYNSLVIAWPDVQTKAAELQAQRAIAKQTALFEDEEGN